VATILLILFIIAAFVAYKGRNVPFLSNFLNTVTR
jgi:hypothetical protein